MKQLISFIYISIYIVSSFSVTAQNSSNKQSAYHYDKPATFTEEHMSRSYDQCTMDTNQYKIA